MTRPRFRATGSSKRGAMNKTESAYAERLKIMRAAGEIEEFWHEALKLRLGLDHRCTYLPDFLVQSSDGVLEIHEVKGHWEDDARVKIQTAARLYPFRFYAASKVRGGWDIEEIRG